MLAYTQATACSTLTSSLASGAGARSRKPAIEVARRCAATATEAVGGEGAAA